MPSTQLITPEAPDNSTQTNVVRWLRIERVLAYERSKNDTLTTMLQSLLEEVRKRDERFHETM
jgi:uncharacterized protein YehS (DUF1456 family)